MKEVLIITNLEQASPRIIGFIKYIEDYWFKPIILCPKIKESYFERFGKLNNVTIYQTDDFLNPLDKILLNRSKKIDSNTLNKNNDNIKIRWLILYILKKGFIFLANFINYPDSHRFWIKKWLIKSNEIIKKHNIELIFSSSSPVSSHIIASKVSKKYDINWVADYRDLWTQNHAYVYNFIRKYFEKKLEKKILSNTSAITTVSYPLVNKLRELHKNKDIYEITNWFFEIENNKNHIIVKNKQFTISYTWQVYTDFQKIDIILKSIFELINENKITRSDIKFNYYWQECIDFDTTVKKLKLKDICIDNWKVSWDKIKEVQHKSELLILLNWEDKKQKWIYYTKSFEYLASKTPFIATWWHWWDVIENLLKNTKWWKYCRSVEMTKLALLRYYNEWKDNWFIKYQWIDTEINKFDYKNTTKELAKIFNKYI